MVIDTIELGHQMLIVKDHSLVHSYFITLLVTGAFRPSDRGSPSLSIIEERVEGGTPQFFCQSNHINFPQSHLSRIEAP